MAAGGVDGRPGRLIEKIDDPFARFYIELYEVDYQNGFSTSTLDQVSLVPLNGSRGSAKVLLSEDVEPATEKPTVKISKESIRIIVGRDAVILSREEMCGEMKVVYERRLDRVGAPPIGPLAAALLSDRIWSRDDLTAKVWQVCRAPSQAERRKEIGELSPLLGVDRQIKVDNSLHNGIRITDIAFLCLAALIGDKDLAAQRRSLETLATGRDGKREVFHIREVSDTDIQAMNRRLKSFDFAQSR